VSEGKRDEPTVPSSVAPARPTEHNTAEMANRYLEQGLPDRAAEIFRKLLELNPDDQSLRNRLIEAEAAIARTRAAMPRRHGDGEPFGMLDLEELPDGYGVDECELIARDPGSLFAYWEITDGGLDVARRQLGEQGAGAKLILRIFSDAAGGREIRDHALGERRGRRYFPSVRPGKRVRGAVGLIDESGLFAPIAHSSTIRVPPGEPAPYDRNAVAWMEVEPARTAGREIEPPKIVRGPETGTHVERTPTGAPTGELGPAPSSSPWRWRPGSGS
jgi:hypothetical protein